MIPIPFFKRIISKRYLPAKRTPHTQMFMAKKDILFTIPSIDGMSDNYRVVTGYVSAKHKSAIKKLTKQELIDYAIAGEPLLIRNKLGEPNLYIDVKIKKVVNK